MTHICTYTSGAGTEETSVVSCMFPPNKTHLKGRNHYGYKLFLLNSLQIAVIMTLDTLTDNDAGFGCYV